MTQVNVQAIFDANPRFRDLVLRLIIDGILEKLNAIQGPEGAMVKSTDLLAAARSLKNE